MLLYAAVKFAAYALWCLLGLKLLGGRPTLPSALRFGALRWLLGLGFGVVAAIIVGSVSAESVATLYFGLYVPLRVVEWAILAVLIARSATDQRPPFGTIIGWVWIAGGIAVSFASDLASPEGMAGRFCVGRCLC